MREDKRYTLDQIKRAFWLVFHEAGELYFSRSGTKEEREEDTNYYWNEFKEGLGE